MRLWLLMAATAAILAFAGPVAACELTNDGKQVCHGATPSHHNRQQRQHSGSQIVSHPAGCPRRRFCGCGVSVKVFGHPVRSLYLAANWVHRFARATPAPGMVAARSGHVFYIEQTYGDGTVLAYDPNSGGHATRIHRRSLKGFHVVDPHRPRYAMR